MNTKDTEALTRNTLDKIGFKLGRGYEYLTQAVWLCLQDETRLKNVTRVYKELAEKNAYSDTTIQIHMRRAIIIAWYYGDGGEWYNVFGSTAWKRPSTKLVIEGLTSFVKSKL